MACHDGLHDGQARIAISATRCSSFRLAPPAAWTAMPCITVATYRARSAGSEAARKSQDIAPTAVFLASDDSAWLTGESLYISISGGLYRRAALPARLFVPIIW